MNNKISVIIFCICLLITPTLTQVSASSDDWPMFHHDPQHTGYSTSEAPDTNNLLWSTYVGKIEYSSPAVVDGRVYIASENGNVHCLYASNGTKIWTHPTDNQIEYSSPAIYDNKVYIGNSCLYASNGTEIWKSSTIGRVESSPVIYNEKVYVVSYNYPSKVYCLHMSNGTEVWNYSTSYQYDVRPSPAIYNEKIYFSLPTVCLDVETGEFQWGSSGGSSVSSPAVAEDKVFTGSDSGLIYCYDATPDDNGDGIIDENDIDNGLIFPDNPPDLQGDLIWWFPTGVQIWASPAFHDGNLYVGTTNDKFYCLDATTGMTNWLFNTSDWIHSSPAIANGKVYFGTGSNDRKLFCLDVKTGNQIWNYTTGGTIDSSPAIYDGKVFVGSEDGKIYCFRDQSSPTIPSIPEGSISGFVNEEYTYTTDVVTDPDRDGVTYGWDFDSDEIIDEWTDTPSSIHIWNEVGTYTIKCKSKDIYDLESDWSDPLIVTITTLLPVLLINCISSVVENEEFDITITSDDVAITNVQVEFNDEIKTTDENGKVTFTTPEVEKNTQYAIIASHVDYTQTSETILVLNQLKEPAAIGHLWGRVSDSSGKPVDKTNICFQKSGTAITDCSYFTDELGQYVISIAPDIYKIEISKDGYETIFESVTIIEKEAIGKNFILKQLDDESIPDETQVEINKAIEEGYFGGEVIIQQGENEILFEQKTFDQGISINPFSKDNEISFIINSDDIVGKSFSFYFDENIYDSTEKIKIQYDGEDIRLADDLQDVLDPTNDNFLAEYYISKDGVIFVSAPEFSEHTITIVYEIVEILGGPVAVMFYIIFIIVGISVVGFPFYGWASRIRKGKKW